MKDFLSIITIFLLFASSLMAQDVSLQREKKRLIEDEIANIDKQINLTRNEKRENLNSLALTKKKIEVRKKLINNIEGEIVGIDKNIEAKNNDIIRLNSRLDTLKTYYENLIYNSYKNRDSRILYMYIMSSENIGQGLRRWSYLRNLSHSVKIQTMNIKSVESDITLEKEKLHKLRDEALVAKNAKEREYRLLSIEEAEVSSTIKTLSSKEKEMKKDLSVKRREVEKLNREIERILAEAVKQQSKGGDKAVIDYELSAKFEENKGKLPWPVNKGIVVEQFGQSFHPVFKNIKMPFNNGVNISTDKNSEAMSVFGGVVKQILIMPGYNQCVLVQHGEYFTFYCKLKKVVVKSGDKIKTGDVIGIVDDSDNGNSIIHFQLWKGTQKQNPEHWLK